MYHSASLTSWILLNPGAAGQWVPQTLHQLAINHKEALKSALLMDRYAEYLDDPKYILTAHNL